MNEEEQKSKLENIKTFKRTTGMYIILMVLNIVAALIGQLWTILISALTIISMVYTYYVMHKYIKNEEEKSGTGKK